ncbi:pyruvate oxidase [Pseudalkalibacillus decolorationis]|uniref:pyruvate oxidase n=1 Tax=Pseudalkalibacillus decolorationis TaxID=163879 RepID=UPI00214782D0|nr:pyruvate oxidase [Pseudalkalibacillus decolorationis]
MFEKRAGEVIVNTLLEWEVDHIYGLPGDSINNLIEDLRKTKDQIQFLQVRHEEVGALAASSYAKLTGKMGVCLSIAGPGAVHLMNGLYDAKADGAPVLVLAGQVESEKLGKDDFQEINLERMFDDVSVFNKRVSTPEQLPDLLNQAIRTAYAEKGVAVLTIPDDIPTQKVKHKTNQTSSVRSVPSIFPGEKNLSLSLDLINKSERPVILVGKGAQNSRKELESFAEKIAAPMIVTLPAKGIIPDEHPYNLGNLGQIGTKPAYEAMEETDLLIMIGTSYPYRDFLPEEAPAIQIDCDQKQIGKRYPVTIGLVGDSTNTLAWLNRNLDRTEERGFLEACQENMQNWWEHLHKEEVERSTPMKPQQVIPQLHKLVNEDAVMSVDVGNVTVWMARYFRMTHQKFIISSWMATMGCGLPGAIAAKQAYPEKQVVAVCGDGGFTMVMHDFVTAVKYKMPIIVVILNNEKIGMIKYEQQEAGHLEYETNLANIDFARFADACGGVGYHVETHEDLELAIENAKGSHKPVLIDVAIQDEPPLPGKIQYGQAASYTKHIVKNFFEKGKFEMPPLKKSLKRLT